MSRKKKNDISNTVLSIQELSAQVKPSTLEEENKFLREHILRLENTIKGQAQTLELVAKQLQAPDQYEIETKPPTQEELIALKQLEFLQSDSITRRLTLEEVKIFDILVKNKRLAQGDSTGVVDMVKLPKDKSKLIEIAARPVKDDESD